MAGVDAAFHALQIIALLPALGEVVVDLVQGHPFKRRRRRPMLDRPHIAPDNAAALQARVGIKLDALAGAFLLALGRNIDALSGDIVFSAMVGATQAPGFIAAKPQRHAAVRA